MSLKLIPKFKNQDDSWILKLIASIARKRDVDCMCLQGFSKITGDTPIYAFVGEKEVVILMVDWRTTPEDELADEEYFIDQPPMYFSSNNKRTSPVWLLSEFTREYKQAMADANVKLGFVWSVFLTNSNLINYDNMLGIWDMMGISVYHNFCKDSTPYVHYSCRFHALALEQYKAFRLYCERKGYLPKDPYAFEGIDADYDEMEFGLDKDDNDIDERSFVDDEDLFNNIEDLFDDDEDEDMEDDDEDTDIDLSHFQSGTMRLSQNKVVNVEILKPLPAPREELEKMVGCQNIKTQISDLIELTKYNKWMVDHYPQWKQHHVSLHAIFLGRPGTGKTTVCKIYGSLLHEAGMLSKGHVVCCNRGTFVGRNWGDEDKAVRCVIEMAKGGVLMIDEAYLLNSNHPNDPGKLVIPLLMDILANEHMRDIAIVLCGYKEEMLRLLDLNPGLDSRFPNRFDFQDFSIDDLLEITRRRIKEYGYRFTRSAWQKYKGIVTKAYGERDVRTWGNARFVGNLLERIYLCHAGRCVRMENPDRKHFLCITSADVEYVDFSKKKTRIGF